MHQVAVRRSISHIGLLQIAIIVLTLITAVIHLQKGIATPSFSAPPGGAHSSGQFGPRPSGGPRGPGGPGGGSSIMSLLPVPLPTLFILNGVAYLVLIISLYLPLLRPFQRIIRWLLIVLAVLTIVAYFLISGTRFNLLGYIDKPIEVALIVLLFIEDWRITHSKVAV